MEATCHHILGMPDDPRHLDTGADSSTRTNVYEYKASESPTSPLTISPSLVPKTRFYSRTLLHLLPDSTTLFWPGPARLP